MNSEIERLRPLICQKLTDIDCFIDDELPEYIVTMLENEKPLSAMTNDLSLFMGAQAMPFVEWIEGQLNSPSGNNTNRSGSGFQAVQIPAPSSIGASTSGDLVSVVSRRHTPATGASMKKKKVPPSRKAGSALRLLTLAMDGAHKDTVKELEAPKILPAKQEKPVSHSPTSDVIIPSTGLQSQSSRRKLMNARKPVLPAAGSGSGDGRGVKFNVTLTGNPSSGFGTAIQATSSNEVTCVNEDPPSAPMPATKRGRTKFLVTLNGKAAATPTPLVLEDEHYGLAPSLKVMVKSKRAGKTSASPIHISDEAPAKTSIVITIPNESTPKLSSTVQKKKDSTKAAVAKLDLEPEAHTSSSGSSSSDSSDSSTSSSESSSSSDSDSDGDMNLSLESEDDEVSSKKPLPVDPPPKKTTRPSSVVVAPKKRPQVSDRNSEATAAKKPRLDTRDADTASGLDVMCRKFPNCPYGRECSFLHPDCPDQAKCRNKLCAYRHAVKKHAEPSTSSSRICKFASNCSKANCPYFHPSASSFCRFGLNCTRRNCSYRHSA